MAETTPGYEHGGAHSKNTLKAQVGLCCQTRLLLFPMRDQVRPSYLLRTKVESSSTPSVYETNNRVSEYSKQMLVDSKGEVCNAVVRGESCNQWSRSLALRRCAIPGISVTVMGPD